MDFKPCNLLKNGKCRLQKVSELVRKVQQMIIEAELRSSLQVFFSMCGRKKRKKPNFWVTKKKPIKHKNNLIYQICLAKELTNHYNQFSRVCRRKSQSKKFQEKGVLRNKAQKGFKTSRNRVPRFSLHYRHVRNTNSPPESWCNVV